MKVEIKQVKLVEPPKEYVITLDQEEANMLRSILGAVSYGHNKQDKDYELKKNTRVFVGNLFQDLSGSTKMLFNIFNNMQL